MRLVSIEHTWEYAGLIHTRPNIAFVAHHHAGKLYVTNNFPHDARLLNVVTDDQRRVIRFTYEHPSFQEVPEGAVIPIINTTFTIHDLTRLAWRTAA